MEPQQGTNSVRVALADGVGAIALSRPERLNALTEDMLVLLRQSFQRLAENQACRAIVISGEGRAFCSGMDVIDGLAPPGDDAIATLYRSLRAGTDMILAMTEAPQPVIAAIQGAAIGGGFALAAAADIRVCAADARFEAPFHRLGASAGDLGLSWLLPRQIGAGRAATLFYTNGSLSAQDALDLGFVSRICPDPAGAAHELARDIAAQPVLGVRMTKELLNASVQSSGFRAHLALEMRSQVLGLSTLDHAGALAALRKRREGRITG